MGAYRNTVSDMCRERCYERDHGKPDTPDGRNAVAACWHGCMDEFDQHGAPTILADALPQSVREKPSWKFWKR